MSAARKAQRAVARNQPEPHEIAGAVDLDALKRREGPSQELIEKQVMAQMGMICPCGERIRSEGVILMSFGFKDGGPAVDRTTFHGRDCLSLRAILESDHSLIPMKPITIQEIPAVEWLDEAEKDAEIRAAIANTFMGIVRGQLVNKEAVDNARECGFIHGDPLPDEDESA